MCCAFQIKTKKGIDKFAVDEHPRPQSTIENLTKLPPVFKKDGVVTAGNASGICDGAAALVLASERAVLKHGFDPISRIVSWGVCVLCSGRAVPLARTAALDRLVALLVSPVCAVLVLTRALWALAPCRPSRSRWSAPT